MQISLCGKSAPSFLSLSCAFVCALLALCRSAFRTAIPCDAPQENSELLEGVAALEIEQAEQAMRKTTRDGGDLVRADHLVRCIHMARSTVQLLQAGSAEKQMVVLAGVINETVALKKWLVVHQDAP